MENIEGKGWQEIEIKCSWHGAVSYVELVCMGSIDRKYLRMSGLGDEGGVVRVESQRNESIEGPGCWTYDVRPTSMKIQPDWFTLTTNPARGFACSSVTSSRVRAARTLVIGVFIIAVLLFAVVPRFACQRSRISHLLWSSVDHLPLGHLEHRVWVAAQVLVLAALLALVSAVHILSAPHLCTLQGIPHTLL